MSGGLSPGFFEGVYMIRMFHPIHGVMDVYLDAEAVENEKNGWHRGTPIQPKASVEFVTTATKESEVPITLTLKRGFGRPKKE